MASARVDPNRLPRTVLPRRYDLTIRPDLGACTYTGRVVIELDVVETTDTVVLNAHDLEITAVALSQPDGARAPTASVRPDPEREQLRIEAGGPLHAGVVATLDVSFAGEISSGLVGFYRSTYVDRGGNEQILGATQFEAPYARRAFPCFDEPDFKAVFGITLEIADGLVALSNGPEIGRETNHGVATVHFGDTMPMSTYLVAWVVGRLELTEPVDAGGVAVRVAHIPGRGHLTKFALDVGTFALRFFADYYGIPYPGEKCDLVALPDFSFGAMENLGCVTFRETRLLLDPAQVTLDEMTGAALTIVHEIAHMWFGDLVTMKWWNGIWLNEAFATFMQYLGIDAYKSEWRTWDDFAIGRAAALDVDALLHTRTVEYEVRTPADSEGMFDTLTYQKGGSVLRMLERWLGADAFRAGVRHYLDRYRLANTETTDLWDALEDATGKPVRQIMDSWIFQAGFPILTPEVGMVAQSRFTYRDATGDGTRWAVPLLARVHTSTGVETRSLLLTGDQVALDAPLDALVVLNSGGEGFYRVAYPAAWRDRLLESGVLDARERFVLVDDLWAAVLAGVATASEFLEVAQRFTDERDVVVWRILSAHLRAAGRLLAGDALDAYKAKVAALVEPALGRLGWEARPGDDARIRQLRSALISVNGSFVGDPETIARAREIDAHPGTDSDIAGACVGVVASVGTDDDFATFVERATTSGSPQQQVRYLHALADFPSEALVLRAAELAMSDAVRPQNAPFVLQRALRNRDHGPAAWVFIRDHWDDVVVRFSPMLIPRIMEGATWLVDDASSNDIPAFLEAHPSPGAALVVAQHLERLAVHRSAWQREHERFAEALTGN
jgi:puromycin-sensitive aminopeptidase